MNSIQPSRYLLSLVGCCLILLLAACGSGGTPPVTGNPTPTATTQSTPVPSPTTGSTPIPTATTASVPPTQTSCPAAGTARAAVTAPLALGSHQNIVYLVSQYQGNTSTGTLKRYDLTTGGKVEIVKLPGVSINNAQVSTNGQWILFVTQVGQQQKLQMVRMDGQGLQTLYCISNGSISNVLWSANQRLVLFDGFTNGTGPSGIYLLNLATGSIQLEVIPTNSGPPLNTMGIGTLLTWLDNTRALVMSSTSAPFFAPLNRLVILDTSRGANQQMSSLTSVFQDKTGNPFNYPCWDADSSYDGSTLFLATCSGISAPNCSGSCSLGTREGPSAINTEPISVGGSQHTIFSSQTLGIALVRSITSSTLLLQIQNFSRNHPIDPSQNGLWKINTNGTGLTRLTTDAHGIQTSLCQYSQNPWSNVSRNASMYAFATLSTGAYPATNSLLIGSLTGGSPTAFASISDGTQMSIVGWTTM